MLISDVITDAKYGELQQLSLKDDDNAILSFINLGLLELYKRFNLRTEEAVVSLNSNTTMYTLDPSLPNVDMPSDCDLMYIIDAYSEAGEQIEINNEDDELSILTPTYNSIQVPNPADGAYLSLIYAAGPTRVTAPTDSLKLPPALYEALLHYIGYRGHGSVDGMINTENNTHYMRFEKSCETAKAFGLVTADDMKIRYVERKGFV